MANTPGNKLPSDIGPPISLGVNVKAVRTISGRKYSFSIQNSTECFQDETNDKCLYHDDVSGYLPPLTPKLTKAGKVAVHQPVIPKRALKWWKAQCGFRGLPMRGTISDLQQRIRSHGAKGLGRGMEEAKNAMRTEYENEVERRWESMNADQKAATWPRRFLYETFLKGRSSRKLVQVVDVQDWGNGIEAACRAMGVCCEQRKMPHHQTGQRTVVLGMDEQAVRSKFAEFNRNAEKVILEQEKEREREKEAKSRAFDSSFLQASKIQKSDNGNWDVSGLWIISCPYIEEEWGSSKSTCELHIRVTAPNDADMVQIWANFDFIVLTGVFRFVNPEAESGESSSTGDTGGALEDDEDDSYDEGGEPESDEETSPSQFFFSRSALPSSTSKKFQFRWRGEETGMGEIQLNSDKDLCYLTFETEDALSGVFESALTGTIDFRGDREIYKADKPLNPGQKRKHELIYDSYPDNEWRSRNEAAYEEARVGRWR